MMVARPQLGDLASLRERILAAEGVIRKLEQNNWDFDAAPELYAKHANADVLAKEVAIFFDGKQETMIGKLTMAGIGTHFNQGHLVIAGETKACLTVNWQIEEDWHVFRNLCPRH